MTFEQPQHLAKIRKEISVRLCSGVMAFTFTFILASHLSLVWLKIRAGRVVPLSNSLGGVAACIGAFLACDMLLRLAQWWESRRGFYIEFAKDGFFPTLSGLVPTSKILGWAIFPFGLVPGLTRVRIAYKYGSGRKFVSFLLEDEEQIKKLREAFMENFPPEKQSRNDVINNIQPKQSRFIKGPAILYAVAGVLLVVSLGFHAAGEFPSGSMLGSCGLAIAVGTVVGNTSLNRYLTD